MSDITREFLDQLEEEFDKRYSSSKKIQSLVKKLNSGKATCEDAFNYAKEVGTLRKIILHENITDEILNDGYLGYQNALKLFDDVIHKNYELIDQYCQRSFTQINKNTGINLKGVSVEYDQDKTDGIVECAVKGKYEDTRGETEEAVVTNAKGYYDASVRKNADFQYKSGLSPKIIRTAVGKTCKWCQSLAGTYDYYEVSDTGNDVFRRHANCDCLVVYSPKKGNYRDVHSKQWMSSREYRIEKQKRIDFDDIKNSPPTGVSSLPERFRRFVPKSEGRRREIIIEGKTSDRAIYYEKDDLAYKRSGYVRPIKDEKGKETFDVMMHGQKYYVEYRGETIDVETLCAIISQRADYQKGQSIRLISCLTGAESDGVAQYVANKLHVNVLAPTTKAFIYPLKNGECEVRAESKPHLNDGKWIWYHDNGKK